MSLNQISWYSYVQTCLLGALRGAFVCTLIHPIESLKYLQQGDSANTKVRFLAKELFEKEGVGGFYRGLGVNIVRSSVTQLWRWPIIMGLPSYLQQKKVSPLAREFYTGITLATLDALTAPMQKARIQIIMSFKEKRKLKARELILTGWRGSFPFWVKLSVNWPTFFVFQRLYKDRYKRYFKKDQLSLYDLLAIGTGVSITSSVINPPFDYVQTLCMSQNKKFREAIRSIPWNQMITTSEKIKLFYKGSLLQSTATMVQSVSSVILIEYLSPKFLLQQE